MKAEGKAFKRLCTSISAPSEKADNDNFNKLWQDALDGIVYVDDHPIAIDHHYPHYDKSTHVLKYLFSPSSNRRALQARPPLDTSRY
jgi:hypothetical protein